MVVNTFESLRELVNRLNASASALSAVGLFLEAAASAGTEVAPAVRPYLDEVLDALDLHPPLDAVTAAAARPLLGEIRATLLLAAGRLTRSANGAGWNHNQPDILQAAGDVSAGFPAIVQRLAPGLDGLVQRLGASDGRFLDVGVGVAILSIEMCRVWPDLQVVGIDPWAPSLALARDNVKAAGLEGRIELREQAGQDLNDRHGFDLAWIPSIFIPGQVIPETLQRVQRALRPGGWLLFATVNPGADRLPAALTRLRTVEWGGYPWSPAEAQAALARAGFTDVHILPGPPTATVTLVAGRAKDNPPG